MFCCDCRSDKDRETTTQQQGLGANGLSFTKKSLCGIGINFRADSTGALLVSSLIPGGPAATTGGIQAGDVLYQVDNTVVYRCPLSHVSSCLLGEEDTAVNVIFLRDDKKITKHIIRAPVANLMMIQKANESERGGE
mmetsp:Transcript_3871/g.9583  ORF Transcript_3871/g.9583 Transcript_3871/m.9583 type:complete len:137 (+) Transcript_3871:118-528(+)